MTNSANWNYPTQVRFGAGRIRELADGCQALGMARPLLVTDAGLAKLPMVDEALNRCRAAGLSVGLFSDVKSNPTGANIDAGVRAYRDGGHDGVIAFGGGSGLDAGKAIAFLAGQTRPLWDFEDVGDNWSRAEVDAIAPILAVPTTAGTGSEVGRASVITDTDASLKRLIFHPKMMPGLVILDPALTISLPAGLTAATGIDALSHNLEAFCSPTYHPMARGIAVEGMRLIKGNLNRVVSDGSDIEARGQMLVASAMGATAFQKGLGAMHALAHPLGAVFDAHHGMLNAVLMPYVLRANRAAIDDDIAWLARALGLGDRFEDFLGWVLTLRDRTGIPDDLAEIGIPADCVERIGEMAVEDPSAATNPIPFTASQYASICQRAIDGDL